MGHRPQPSAMSRQRIGNRTSASVDDPDRRRASSARHLLGSSPNCGVSRRELRNASDGGGARAAIDAYNPRLFPAWTEEPDAPYQQILAISGRRSTQASIRFRRPDVDGETSDFLQPKVPHHVPAGISLIRPSSNRCGQFRRQRNYLLAAR